MTWGSNVPHRKAAIAAADQGTRPCPAAVCIYCPSAVRGI